MKNNNHFFVQRNCIEFALKAKPVRRYIPKHRIQYKVWWFVTSQPFEYTIFTLIMINTVTLAMKFYRQPEIYTSALDVLNMIFTAVFALEFVFKLAAFRFKVRPRISICILYKKKLFFLLCITYIICCNVFFVLNCVKIIHF